MATTILIKRSTTSGEVPTTSDLAVGELAINTADKRIFTNNSGTIVELGTTPSTQAVTGNATVGGTFSVVGAVSVDDFTATGTVNLTGATTTVATPTADSHAATKLYVDTAVNDILDGAPAALDTLNEIAAAINDDANVYTTLTNSIATKLPLAGGTMTGSIDMGANKVTSTATPTADSDLTRKAYVDDLYQSTVDAETSAANALASEQAAATSASNAATSASTAATQASNASSSATAAASSATQASNSATSSANSATAAASSATAASNSATTASGHADNAEASATAAASSATAAAQSATDAANALDTKVSKSGDTMTGNLNFGDNDKAQFGAGNDLQIYHSGFNSFIDDSGTGQLKLRSNGTGILLGTNDDQEIFAQFTKDGASTIYHDGSSKLATTSTGVDVTGTVTADGLVVDSSSGVTVNGPSNQDGKLNLVAYAGVQDAEARILAARGNTSGTDSRLKFYTNNGTSLVERVDINDNGDISFYEDTGTTPKFFWDASAESLGIGTSSPDSPLDVVAPLTNSVYASFSSTDTRPLQLSSFNTTSVDAGHDFNASSGNGALSFSTGSSERMRIDSSGNLHVGKTSTNTSTVGTTLLSNGRVTHTAANDSALELNRTTSDGVIINFRKDGSTVGSIGSTFGIDMHIGTGDTRLRFVNSSDYIRPANSDGSTRDGLTDLGVSNARFKDLYLSGGVYLGGTGSANHFDDYEEGTWTVDIIGSTTAGSYSSISRYAWYVKVGRLVTVGFVFYGSSGTGAGDIRISGLPFTPAGNTDAVGSLQYNAGLDLPSGTNTPSLITQPSNTDMQVRCNSDGTGAYSHMPYPTLANYVRGSISYYTNS
jgi:hypothetical protein